MEQGSDGLRKAAPNWSLHGDHQLLQLLQNVHQKIIEKCQATNKNLEDMVSALDTASIHLQNVNNKFTALSNSQFIESRVHEDDLADRRVAEIPKEQPQPISPRPLDIEDFREGLSVLERMHETVAIVCDSDSDTASDDDDGGTRLVVKPRDLYASRPLPYIIGSTQWKRKWHAGLIPEDSDSESSGSVDDSKPTELYSDTDSERSERPPPRSPTISTSTIASRNPSIASRNPSIASRNPSVDFRNPSVDSRYPSVDARYPIVDTVVTPLSQSDIAAELARRLGAAPIQVPVAEAEPFEPEPAVRKVYRPHQPTPGTIFPDEPPPIDDAQSEDSDHDIFAEIYKTNSYAQSEKDQVSVADDLFGKPIFDEQKPTTTKPIGAKSIFGSSANSDSIGAAILQRKSRHSSTSDDESERESTPVATSIKKSDVKNHNVSVKSNENKNNDNISTKSSNESQNKKERDIFDELFAKSEKANKADKIKDKKPIKDESKAPAKNIKKVDLFSDNLFDDIDDIFSKSVKEIPGKEKTPTKSIFDDENDDLFSDLAFNNDKNKTNIENKENSNVKDSKNFDNANEKRKGDQITKVNDKITVENKNISTLIKEPKGVFDDSDDDIFSDFNKPKNIPVSSKIKAQTIDLFSDDDEENLFSSKSASNNKVTPKLVTKEKGSSNNKKFVKSPDIFDDDISETMSPKIDTKEDLIKTNLPENLTVNVSNQESVNGTVVSSQGNSENSKNLETKPAEKSEKPKNKHDELDDEFADDLFGKPVKSMSERPNNKTLQESHLTKDRFNDMIIKTDIFADNTNASIIPNLDTKITVSKEVIKDSVSEKVLETNVVNAQVNISENESEKTVVITPEMSIKPTVEEKNIHTDVTQIQGADNLDTKNNDKKDAPSNYFLGDTPLPKTPKIIPDSKTVVQSDSFDDIFNDQPPAFEKPKERKRSKNVNALFDDDSDDESLFLKKNDVITDEQPEEFIAGDDRIFGIFRDEPPAIDVDFVQQPNKKDNTEKSPAKNEVKRPNVVKNIDFDDVDDDIFAIKSNFSTPNPQNAKESDMKQVSNVMNDFEKNLNSSGTHTLQENTNISNVKNIFESDGAKSDILDTTDSPQAEPKKIGKLKSMNFNIDVNTLLPGASHKKAIKKEVQDNIPDKQTLDKREELSDEVDIPENIETKMVKSVSFEGEPDSTVLDNKLSKERAKIKVKRRPSTRRARKEAARKSGIDFGEDVPDSSTPVDDLQPCDSVEEITEAKTGVMAEISCNVNKIDTREQENIAETVEVNKDTVTTRTSSTLEGIYFEAQNKDNTPNEKSLKDALDFGEPKNTNVNIQSSIKKEIKTKVVYVLNDDDIFNTNATKIQKSAKTSIFDDFGDDDDIFSTIPVAKNTTAKDSKQEYSDEMKISDGLGKNKENDSVRKHEDLLEKLSKLETRIETHKHEEPNKTVKVDKNIAISGTSHNPQDSVIKTRTAYLDSDEELFKKVSKPVTKTPQSDRDIKVIKSVILDNDDSLFKNQPIPISNITKTESTEGNLVEEVSKPIQDQKVKSFINTSDDDDDNLFKTNIKTALKSKESESNIKNEIPLVDSDEDLFKSNNKVKSNTKSNLQINQNDIDSQENENNTKKKSAVVDLDEEFFNNNNKTKNNAKSKPQNKVTENNNKKKMLVDDSDDDLFKNNNKKVDKVAKPALFDSDSDEELFGGKQKTKKYKKEVKEEVLTKKVEAKKFDKKTSLFGDDSDDDELFGATKRVTESKSRPAPSKDLSKETALVNTKSVLEDPLSMFGDDD